MSMVVGLSMLKNPMGTGSLDQEPPEAVKVIRWPFSKFFFSLEAIDFWRTPTSLHSPGALK